MKYTFECSEWGVPAVRVRLSLHPFEENQVYISFLECPFGLRGFLDKPCPKGQGLLRLYHLLPPKCPHCDGILPEGGILERKYDLRESWEYSGLEVIDFNTHLDNDLEVRCKYETVKLGKRL